MESENNVTETETPKDQPVNTPQPPRSSSFKKRKVSRKKTTLSSTQPPSAVTGKKVDEEVKELDCKRSSWVWQHFKLFKKDGEIKSSCNYCGREYASDGKNHGTSNQISHLKKCSKYPHNAGAKQTTLMFAKKERVDITLKAVNYSYEECRSKLIKMIIVDEFPFRMVEAEGFIEFVVSLQPRFVLPSRITISRDCMKLYLKEKKRVKKLIKSERIYLTTDTWTSIQNINYMCLTAHWIDENWKLQKRILSFSVVPNHKGKTLDKMIENRLLDWGIEKLLTLTVDNASSNDGAINYLKKNTKGWKTTTLDHEFLHMRCCAHILNLIVKDGLKHQSESILRTRKAIKYVRSSPSRLESFKKCANVEKIESKSLLSLDIETRWNSTYLMLISALKFERAFERLKEDDSNYNLYFFGGDKGVDEGEEFFDQEETENERNEGGRGRHVGPPSEVDWDAARSFVKFLKIFYDVTLKFSGSLNVTSNKLFEHLVAIQTTLQAMSKLNDLNVFLMAKKMQEKFAKILGESR